MIQYTIMNSPVGKLLLAQSKKGLNHIIFEYQIYQLPIVVPCHRVLATGGGLGGYGGGLDMKNYLLNLEDTL